MDHTKPQIRCSMSMIEVANKLCELASIRGTLVNAMAHNRLPVGKSTSHAGLGGTVDRDDILYMFMVCSNVTSAAEYRAYFR